MFSLITVKVGAPSYGPNFTGVAFSGKTNSAERASYASGDLTAAQLSIPHDDLQEHPDVFSLLRWRSQTSTFAGRDQETDELLIWVNSHPSISIKFVIGEGGVGKTRLAAEFARVLSANHDWASGFIDLRKPHAFQMMEAGTLLIIDYPEESLAAISEFLRDLASLNDCSRLRILFLTRFPLEFWRPLIDDNKVSGLVDNQQLILGNIPEEETYKIFSSTQECCAEALGTVPRPFPEELFLNWVRSAPHNQRVLFIVAAAVHSALFPESETLQYESQKVVRELVHRERSRLRGIAKEHNFHQHDVLNRILAIAAVTGGLEPIIIKSLAEEDIELGLPPAQSVIDEISQTGLMNDGVIEAPTPDILAASFVLEVFIDREDRAPVWLWSGIRNDITNGLARIGRLMYDANIVLGYDNAIGKWLGECLDGNPSHCLEARPYFLQGHLPFSMREVDMLLWQTLADHASNEFDRAAFLNNLAFTQLELGKNDKALNNLEESLKINENFKNIDSDYYNREVGINYINLFRIIFDNKDYAKAEQTVKKGIQHLSSMSNLDLHAEHMLAVAYTSEGRLFENANRTGKALSSFRKAIKILEKKEQMTRLDYIPDQIIALKCYALTLSKSDRISEAQKVLTKALNLGRTGVSKWPERFEIEFARTLIALATVEDSLEKYEVACDLLLEAKEITKPTALAVGGEIEGLYLSATCMLRDSFLKAEDSESAEMVNEEVLNAYKILSSEFKETFELEFARAVSNKIYWAAERSEDVDHSAIAVEALSILRKRHADIPSDRFDGWEELLNSAANRSTIKNAKIPPNIHG